MNKNNKKYGNAVFWCTTVAYVLFFGFVCLGYISKGRSPVRLANPRFLETVYPAGWGYFTHLPDEKVYKLYELKHNQLIYCDLRSFTRRFSFGLDRSNGVMAMELQSIISDTTQTRIFYNISMPGNEDINNYIKADTLKFNDILPTNAFLLKGKIVITEESPIDPQKRKTVNNTSRPIYVIPINVLSR